MDTGIISSPHVKGHVYDMDFVKSKHHFVNDDFMNSWMVIIGKCFYFGAFTLQKSEILHWSYFYCFKVLSSVYT